MNKLIAPMITRTTNAAHAKTAKLPTTSAPNADWHAIVAAAVREPRELLELLELPAALLPAAQRAASQFPLRVPRGFLARMRRGDPNDPLLRQVLPLAEELSDADPGFNIDPVGDLNAMTTPGLLHKYHGRALLVTTGACAVHCRYCFRRHFPYAGASTHATNLDKAVAQIAADDSLSELILSGGDPLSLANSRLAALAEAIRPIRHLRRLRLHTRLPVVVPERIDAGLLAWIDSLPVPLITVLHINHAQEIDSHVLDALAPLRQRAVTLLNQAVLLKGVNDRVTDQIALSERLFTSGILPYYLHALDRVKGAAHFDVAEQTARVLMQQLRAKLPGYLVPKLVREIAGADAKTPL